MKPRNKFQHKIATLSQSLPSINEIQKQWAYMNCLEHYAHKTKQGVVSCLECGNSWTDKDLKAENTICPHCGQKLKVLSTRKRIFNQTEYLCITTTFKGYQVLRFIYVYSSCKVGQAAYYFSKEVVQRWIEPSGKYATLARLRPMINYYCDSWIFTSDLELRPEKELYDIIPSKIYPRMRLLPAIKRNGFKGEFHNLTPFEMFYAILTDNKAETLLKTKQTKMLKYYVRGQYRTRSIDEYWASIRICNRNNYLIEDASLWCDYIYLLRNFGKDITNAKYVCPDNLKLQHDHLMIRKEKQDEKDRIASQRAKAIENEKAFKDLKSKFFGIAFSDGKLDVRVLESVEEYMEEGKAMHHCVFSNQYYLNPDSLILSACIEGQRIETIEVSLKTFKVIQCRGLCNANTEHHDQIINLVNSNSKLIRQRIVA